MIKNGIAFLIRTSMIENPKCPKAIILNKNKILIGRRADIRMDTNSGKEVSKKHAEITRKIKRGSACFIIEDLDSVNGTFVNQRKILKQTLTHKDDIVFAGGNKYCFGDILQEPEKAECAYRFVIPPMPVDFRYCTDFDIVLQDKDKQEECCVCYTKHHKMHQLPCGHSFCVGCLSHWARVCSQNMRQVVCPVCRRPFTRSEVENDAPIIEDGVEIIKLVEPLLQTINASSVAEVKEVVIDKLWDQQKKEKFWKYQEIVSDLHTLKRSFHSLVHASYWQILKMDDDQLKNVILNLDGTLEDITGTLLEEAIARVAIMVMGVNKSKPKLTEIYIQ